MKRLLSLLLLAVAALVPASAQTLPKTVQVNATTNVLTTPSAAAFATANSLTTSAQLAALSSVYQPLDSDLTSLSALSTTAYGRSLLEAANALALRALAGTVIGTDVQAYDADLTTWAGITPGTGVATALATNTGSAGAVVVNGGALGTPSSGVATNLTGTAAGLTAGSVTTIPTLSGEVTSSGNSVTLSTTAVVGKALTGYASTTGTITASDTIVGAISKLNGNIGAVTGGIDVSAVSALADRASPRGGIKLYGDTYQRVRSTLTGQTIGTKEFSLSITCDLPSRNLVGERGLIGLSSNPAGMRAASSFSVEYNGEDVLSVWMFNAANNGYRYAYYAGMHALYGGKIIGVIVTRAGDSVALYVNGKLIAPTATGTAGVSPPAWSDSIDGTYLSYGSRNLEEPAWNGSIYSASLYNYAMAADKVLAVYKNGGEPLPEDEWAEADGQQITDLARNSVFSAAATDWVASGGSWAATVDNANGELDLATSGSGFGNIKLSSAYGPNFVKGKSYKASFTVRNYAFGGGDFGLTLGTDGTDVNIAPTSGYITANGDYSGIAVVKTDGASLTLGLWANSGSVSVTNFSLERVGAVVHFSSESGGIGLQWHDCSTHKFDAVLTYNPSTPKYIEWLNPKRSGYVRTPGTGQTWSSTHEGKSWLGQRALPIGAAPTMLVLTASAATTGGGATVGSTNSATRWGAATALAANTRKKITLANDFPASATTINDNDLVTEPDTAANYTGTIVGEMHYSVTEGTP